MRLLIVEDDPDGRAILTEVFRKRGWTVTAVATAQAALKALRAGGLDVVLSDEDLQGQSGASMLRTACGEGLLANVGTLMYTAELAFLEVPADVRILRKPAGMAALLDAVHGVLPTARARSASLTPRAPESTTRPSPHSDRGGV